MPRCHIVPSTLVAVMVAGVAASPAAAAGASVSPTWPVDPEPLTAPAEPAPPADDERSGWLLTGLGLVGAGIAAGGAAGIARRYRIRAQRLAV